MTVLRMSVSKHIYFSTDREVLVESRNSHSLVSFLPAASSVLADSCGIHGKIQAVLMGGEVQEPPASINES